MEGGDSTIHNNPPSQRSSSCAGGDRFALQGIRGIEEKATLRLPAHVDLAEGIVRIGAADRQVEPDRVWPPEKLMVVDRRENRDAHVKLLALTDARREQTIHFDNRRTVIGQDLLWREIPILWKQRTGEAFLDHLIDHKCFDGGGELIIVSV